MKLAKSFKQDSRNCWLILWLSLFGLLNFALFSEKESRKILLKIFSLVPWPVWLSWLERHPAAWRIVNSIPGLCTSLHCRFGPLSGHMREATNQCFSLTSMFLFPSFFLPLYKHVLGWKFLKNLFSTCIILIFPPKGAMQLK